MSFLRNATRGLAAAVLLLSMGGWASAAELKENTADIKQDISIPGMAVTIKRPGGETGCNAANHEKWDTTKGGCSNTEYMKENAQVVSIASDEYRLSIGVIESTTLTANVRTKDGQPVGAGVPVSWSTSKGYLSASSSTTNAASQAIVTLTTPKGTPKGPTTIAATAKGGGTSILVVVANSTAISGLTAMPPTALADGSSVITLRATLTYENGQSVGAGEGLSWGTNIGNYTYAETVTNPNGQALAYLVSTVPGTDFASAIRDVPTLAQVNFTSPAPVGPVIDSFSVKAGARGKFKENELGFDYDIAYWAADNVFTWSATGADRFELVDQYGQIHYSGTASGVTFGNQPIGGWGRDGQYGSKLYLNGTAGRNQSLTFTLRAYKGEVMVTKQLTARALWNSCGGGCST